MAKYKCSVCGFVYDEEKEGRPISEVTVCPVCGQPVSKLIRIDEDSSKAEKTPAAEPESSGYEGSLAYDPQFSREDPDARYMEEIHEMAVTGKTIGAAMGTRMPMPGWDDILLLGAQLDPPPKNDNDYVDARTVIGRHAKKPMVLENPVFISHMSFGALSKEIKTALAQVSALDKKAM